ncbi:serine hydrolase domain-containing protein [Actinoalloteichus spitiensis]|uniref:serine hydrolase domain-containing protein n=1 Tax=Actinoalloteichus spitiensis TaxID=252394 RepID=UPI00036A3FD0|nr:serine hydrolase domain-containing protein [Actinoalloteichus spitiensis]
MPSLPLSARSSTLVALVTAAALGIGLHTRPGPSQLPEDTHGSRELTDLVLEIAGEDHRALAAAVVTPQGRRTTVIGTAHDSRFEAGSITKGITGLLLADAIDRGEVTEDTRVGTLLDQLDGTPAGAATLAELATHTSGLPPQIPSPHQYLLNLWASWTGAFPYPSSTEDRLAEVAGLAGDSEPGTYSNVAFEVLGAALAEVAGQDYPGLARERVLDPVGLADAHVPTSPDELDRRDLRGEDAAGRAVAPWAGESMAPAGGLRIHADDLAVLLSALLDGTAPGIDALGTRGEFGSDRIGLAWITTETEDGRQVVWHNGHTSGFAAFLAVDREAGTGVALVSATGQWVDAASWELLERAREL